MIYEKFSYLVEIQLSIFYLLNFGISPIEIEQKLFATEIRNFFSETINARHSSGRADKFRQLST